MCLALLGVGVHAQHAQHQLLVLHVAVLQQGLEACPVLCGDVRSDGCVHLVFLQLFLQEVLCILLTLTCQFLVQVHTTIGRSVTAYFQFVDGFALVLISLFDSGLQVLHLLALGLRRTEVGLLDEELDIRFLHLLDHALELIGRYHRLVVACLCQLHGSHQSVSNLQFRHLYFFLPHLCCKAQEQLALVHSRYIVKRATLRILTACFVINGRTVLLYFLAYIRNRATYCLASLVFEHGSYGEHAFLSEFLYRESAGNVSAHLIAYHGERTRVHADLFRLGQRLAARCQHCYCNERKK